MTQADTEDGWLSRANENGIRVGSKDDDSLMCDEGMPLFLILFYDPMVMVVIVTLGMYMRPEQVFSYTHSTHFRTPL